MIFNRVYFYSLKEHKKEKNHDYISSQALEKNPSSVFDKNLWKTRKMEDVPQLDKELAQQNKAKQNLTA